MRSASRGKGNALRLGEPENDRQVLEKISERDGRRAKVPAKDMGGVPLEHSALPPRPLEHVNELLEVHSNLPAQDQGFARGDRVNADQELIHELRGRASARASHE